ncbi:MAG: hypothetical protein AAF805_05240 [Planctomycetota bacterium]
MYDPITDDERTAADPMAWSEDRYALQDRYLELTRELLPRAAERGGWRLRENHCFMRVLLDDVCGDAWRRVLDPRLVAYKQLTNAQLRHVVSLGERVLAEGEPLLATLNRQSLRWRGKGG